MPAIDHSKKYHWPSSANSALASMSRWMFSFTNANNRLAIDSLEMAMKGQFTIEADSGTIEFSASYGKRVAQKVFDWAETDGYRRGNEPYTPRRGPGMWAPTAPSFAKASTPYWGNLRPIVPGSNDNTQPLAPIPYSEKISSDFYKVVKQVHDVSRNLTQEQKTIALFWRDINPGVTAPGHWLNILRQVFQKEKTPLDKAVFAYALSGMALNDAWISCWKTRYTYNLLRPITYIHDVIGNNDWQPLLPTPPHPEYPSGFAAMAGAISEALTLVFGNNYKLTDHTYDHLGMAPRSFRSFRAIANEAGISKLYAGIHYQFSIDIGLQQGKEVTQNIASILLNKGKPVPPKKDELR